MTEYSAVVERMDAHAESVHGQLEGVEPTSIQITEGYYTDSRIQAQLTTHGDDGYQAHERLRIVLYVDGEAQTLMTGFVTERTPSTKAGEVQHDYTVDSSLYALSTDLLAMKWTLQGSGLALVRQALRTCGRAYDDSGARDKWFGGAKVFDIGTTYLSMIFEAVEGASRVDVDGRGRVTLRPYVRPSDQSPTRWVDPESADSVVVGDIETTDDSLSTPGRVIAKSGSGDDEQWAVADVDASSDSSSAKRGYMVAETVDSNSEGADYASLLALAKSTLAGKQSAGNEHKLTAVWGGWHQGQVVNLRVYGSWRKCLVKSVTTDFGGMTQQLTLKEV